MSACSTRLPGSKPINAPSAPWPRRRPGIATRCSRCTRASSATTRRASVALEEQVSAVRQRVREDLRTAGCPLRALPRRRRSGPGGTAGERVPPRDWRVHARGVPEAPGGGRAHDRRTGAGVRDRQGAEASVSRAAAGRAGRTGSGRHRRPRRPRRRPRRPRNRSRPSGRSGGFRRLRRRSPRPKRPRRFRQPSRFRRTRRSRASSRRRRRPPGIRSRRQAPPAEDAEAFATVAISSALLIEDRAGQPGAHHRLGILTTIGRTPDNQVVVPVREVSRRHAEIVLTEIRVRGEGPRVAQRHLRQRRADHRASPPGRGSDRDGRPGVRVQGAIGGVAADW